MEVKDSKIDFIEYVTLKVKIKIKPGKLNLTKYWFTGRLTLTSPDGKIAKFYDYRESDSLMARELLSLSYEPDSLILLTNRFLGSSVSNGMWKLQMEYDEFQRYAVIDEITSWNITVEGH